MAFEKWEPNEGRWAFVYSFSLESFWEWGVGGRGFESNSDGQNGETATERPGTAREERSDSKSIVTMLRQMGYKNEILLNLNMLSDPAKFILLGGASGDEACNPLV